MLEALVFAQHATEHVLELLTERFKNAVSVAQQQRSFQLEDLDAQIDSA